MALRYMRFIKSLPLFMVAFFLLAKIRSKITYERSLNAAAIALDDFPSDYTQALIAAQREDKQPEYHWSKLTDPGPAAQETIPPIIHFIWFPNLYHNHLDISKIPTVGSDTPELCQKHNPDYQINIWNASAARALLEEHYGWFLPRYDAYRYPIQRVDAFKYFVLWHYGGVYMDLDISCRRALDPLLQFAAWYPKASPSGVNNDLMATRARHPLTGMMLEQLAPRDKDRLFPYLTIFWSTGPSFVSGVLRSWSFKHVGAVSPPPKRPQDFDKDGVHILPQEFYSEKYTFFGHRPGGTWHGKDVAVVLWLVDRPWIFVLCPALAFVLLMYIMQKRRSWKFGVRASRPQSDGWRCHSQQQRCC
jgi:mannosyltransferase OCH1-like enzyme